MDWDASPMRPAPSHAVISPGLESPAQLDTVVLFDGVCNLCNCFVDFVIKRDRHGHIRFASLQSDAGKKLVARFELSQDIDYVVLVRGDRARIKSSAALHTCRHLRFPWPAAQIFLLVPRLLRDWVYDRIARNRYRMFGKRDTCRVPTEEEKSRFIG